MLDYKLYTFLSLCKHMNYRLAAQELNITQPAVTNHIKQLEYEYSCKLFIYQNRQLYKTSQAEVLEKYVQSADINSKRLVNDITEAQKPFLRIGATKTIGDYILNKKISELLKTERINLTYIIDNTSKLLKELKNGHIDFAFIEGFINKNEYTAYPYTKEKFVGICSNTHPFAEKNISLSDIFKENLIIREEGSGTREALERLLFDNNIAINSFQNIISCNSFKSITDFVKFGNGISFVYEPVISDMDMIKTFTISNFTRYHEFNCIHLKNTNPSKFINFFLNN